MPVHSCLMLETAEAAAAFPQDHVRLAQCSACGFVTNIAFDPAWSAYAPEYEDQQSFSPTFNAFADGLARDLIDRHGLTGRHAVEVGCSKGDFLALLCARGAMKTVGIDPSVVPGRVPVPERGTMQLIQAYYGPEHLRYPADLLVCRHTLEHIRDVAGMLRLMHRHVAATPGAVLCIEVPDATRVWAECAFEDIYYEHCSYFTPGSLAAAVREAGFGVSALYRDYGDQYLVLEAVADPAKDRRFAIEETPAQAMADVEAFAARVEGVKAGWRDALRAAKGSGRRVAIWGSGSKCVALLRSLDATDWIDAIIDINPHRAGKVAPGLTLPIASPEALRAAPPDLLVVMNPIYREEIAAHCAGMGLHPRILALGTPPDRDA